MAGRREQARRRAQERAELAKMIEDGKLRLELTISLDTLRRIEVEKQPEEGNTMGTDDDTARIDRAALALDTARESLKDGLDEVYDRMLGVNSIPTWFFEELNDTLHAYGLEVVKKRV